MCTCTGRCACGDDLGLAELPGCFRDLFHGPPIETGEQRAARVAVAREVLAELLDEGASDAIAMQDALYAVRLGGGDLLRDRRLTREAA
ncbi:hypothetical protein [Streptomyces sp. NBC_01190]|uniref:hypothetical protein n=1 Tax=Streptomyces sp. NBC_01190 TaxID=2903767 RepID=UPI00386C982D|nr:hypothetical protein OG519_16315 [Streptomyces sp. NBC_01190]